MQSTAEMRATLKVMRESSADHVPVSRMKKADISGAIERLKHLTETTPAIAQTKKGLPESMKSDKTNEPVRVAPKKKATLNVGTLYESSSEDEAPMVLKASKKPLVVKEVKAKKPEASKENMKDRMARIRAMKKKD